MTTTTLRKRNGYLLGNPTLAAMDRMELYCAANPGSPTAARRPQLLYRNQLWIALLGPNQDEGIVGIGQTVEAALRAFDAQYLTGLRPPSDRFRRGLYHSTNRVVNRDWGAQAARRTKNICGEPPQITGRRPVLPR